MSKKPSRVFLYCPTTILFSLMEISLKSVSGSFHPFQINFTRFLIGGLVLLPFALQKLKKRGADAPNRIARALLKMAGLGFIGIFVSMTFYQLSVMHTDASVVAYSVFQQSAVCYGVCGTDAA